MTALKTQIQQGLVDRLKTIQNVNGYDLTVEKVYFDQIPMGMDLADFELPAILCIAGQDKPEQSHGCMRGNWSFELQLIHGDQPDSVMDDFVRAVLKAVYANSPTAQVNTAFRGPPPNGIHASVYDVNLKDLWTDLNMIEANRMYGVVLGIRYETKLWNF